jgi:hypothetical protein
MQQYFCTCTARIWGPLPDFNFWCFWVLSFVWSWWVLFFFFASLVPLPGVFSFIYLTLFPIHTCPCTLSSFFFFFLLPLFPCPVFFPLFIYLTSFPIHTCPCTLSTFHSSIGVQILHAFTIIMSMAFSQLLNLCPVHGP